MRRIAYKLALLILKKWARLVDRLYHPRFSPFWEADQARRKSDSYAHKKPKPVEGASK